MSRMKALLGSRSPHRRPGMLAVAAPFLLLCSLYGPGARPHSAARTARIAIDSVPLDARLAAEAPAIPGDYRGCGRGALPETGLQGEVPKADQVGGRSSRGYRCNLRLIGQNNMNARGANIQLAWYKNCAYISIIGVREFFPNTANPQYEGIGVIDASNPRRPRFVQTIRSWAGRNQHEGLEVNPRRGMLVAEQGGISARYIEVYDVSKDCRHPQLKSRYDSGAQTFHGLKISDDGNTIYATDGIGQGTPLTPLHVFDVSDMSNPRLLKTWGPGDAGLPFFLIHDLDLSHDGKRAYLGATPPNTGALGFGIGAPSDTNTGPTVVTLDTTDIRNREPNPNLRVVSRIDEAQFGHTVQRAVIGGKPYVIASGESPFASGLNCPWAWGYLIDMSDERNPRAVSQLKLQINQAQNCARANADNVTYSIHYVGVDDEFKTTKVFYTYYGGGLRVFDVRHPAHPKEIAYYHPRAQPSTVLQPILGTYGGDAQTPAFDSATSVVRYRPEDGQIWFASIGGGLNVVKLTGSYACLPASVRARGSRLGLAVLGRLRARQRSALQAPLQPLSRRSGRAVDTYCTTDAHSTRIAYSTAWFSRRLSLRDRRRVSGRAVLILSDSPFASAKGIRPGASVSKLRRRFRGARAVRAFGDVWYFARSSHVSLVFKTRRSRVIAVGVADASLTSTTGEAKGLLLALLG